MISVQLAASYIYCRYLDEMHQCIDEMKLHKLLYLAQRESFIVLDKPMFQEQFEAWKYGPVMVCIRDQYKNKLFPDSKAHVSELAEFLPVFDYVFENYACQDSWFLSDLTHGESSWINARKGFSPDANCNVRMSTEDIRKDAERIKTRRFYFDNVLPAIHEDN